MTQFLPKWELKAYAILWSKYKSKEFYHEDARKLLDQKKEVTSTLLYDLRKGGWLEVALGSGDSRKRVYKLKTPEKGFKELMRELAK